MLRYLAGSVGENAHGAAGIVFFWGGADCQCAGTGADLSAKDAGAEKTLPPPRRPPDGEGDGMRVIISSESLKMRALRHSSTHTTE